MGHHFGFPLMQLTSFYVLSVQQPKSHWKPTACEVQCKVWEYRYGKRAFSVAAPELWNNLPEDIKSANSIDDFKRKLKSFLFMRAYES